MHDCYLNAIKNFEGYSAEAKWDYRQHTSGFGTKARFAGEILTPEEADRRFAEEIAEARRVVEKYAGDWDDGTKAALTSLTFNAGTSWIKSGLGEAVGRRDVEAVKERFLQYTRAGGEVLPGLVKRRFAELAWIGNPDLVSDMNRSASMSVVTKERPMAMVSAAEVDATAPVSQLNAVSTVATGAAHAGASVFADRSVARSESHRVPGDHHPATPLQWSILQQVLFDLRTGRPNDAEDARVRNPMALA